MQLENESYKNVFEMEDSQESFLEWINKPYISSNLRDQLAKSNLLIIPREGVRENIGPVFPSGTEELFIFLKENAGEDLRPEICIEDDDYVELIEHWDLFTVGHLLVNDFVAPLVVNLIYDFIKSRVGPRMSKTQAKFDLTIIDDSIHMHYEGPAEEIRETLLTAMEELKK
jgi:hypothetical protein